MNMAKIQAIVDYEDDYVQPLLVAALKKHLPPELLEIISAETTPDPTIPLLQWRSYETLDFDRALVPHPTQLINAYVIRKALIRKHYLSHTVHAWTAKHPESALKQHVKPAVDFELDYAEFLDDALVEAFELRAAFAHNAALPPPQREHWILKPGMSDRGQGIRLFSTEEELTSIFEAWEADEPDDDDEDEVDNATPPAAGAMTEGIVTSHLRHFVAQPYIHPPLLIAAPPFAARKFHVRTYAVAAGALAAYVYDDMLALFAAAPYAPPWAHEDTPGADAAALQRMRDVHLSNTCVQGASAADKANSVFALDALPLALEVRDTLKAQIRACVAELFRAALAQPVHFQALPGAFEVFGLDFLVSDDPVCAWLLEVNAFPDFAQTGDGELGRRVVGGLFEEVVRCVVAPRFGVGAPDAVAGNERFVRVLDAETGLK